MAIGSAWEYNTESGSYVEMPYVTAGTGFWLMVGSDTVINLVGDSFAYNLDCIFEPGWHLFGGPAVTLPANNFTNSPIVLGDPYGYNPETRAYLIADTLFPGLGYWIYFSDTLERAMGAITDIDGNVYRIISIGSQVWMAENLKVTHYRNGTAIPNVTDATEWSNLDDTETGAYCEYNNDPSNILTYGRLYNWYAVDDSRCLAPAGWHVPTDEEWKTLEIYLGMSPAEADSYWYRGTNEGSKLAGRADLWYDGDLEDDPEFGSSGFTALPGGYRTNDGTFYNMSSYATFWSSSEYSTALAWYRTLNYYYTDVDRLYINKQAGFSVRCLRD
ncbi:fibrobacter succinogenes major paralogous domain-containing protein [bacterium]|nr:fibrobacter succinogenes major paralogous domain-containing protein [bacterium]